MKKSLKLKAKSQKLDQGFTIIELLVATTVFSIVLLVALASFLRMSQLFFKGVVIDHTRIAADQIMADLRAGFNSNSSYGNGAGYYCVGGSRYSYLLYKPVDLSQEDIGQPNPTHYGLVKDTPSGCGAPPGTPFVNPQELLGNHMRLSQLDISQASAPRAGKVYTISLKIAYGDDTALSDGGTSSPSCVGNLSLTEFCTVNSLFSALNLGQ